MSESIVDKIKEAIGIKLPPEPSIEAGNEWYTKLPKQIDDRGVLWYWLAKTANPKEGQWFPEPLVKIWYYGDQMAILEGKLKIVDAKIKTYVDEINKIDEYLAAKKLARTQEDIAEESLRNRIDLLEKQKEKLIGEGYLKTDISYRKVQYAIDELSKKLSPRTPSTDDKIHITSWPLEPGTVAVPDQDLYVIRGAHRVKIKNIEKKERDPLDNALSDNQTYRDYWNNIYQGIVGPAK